MKNNTQPALKERIEKALEDFTKGRASMHVPPLDTDVDVVLAECSDRLSELKARCAALAAENAGLKQRTQQLIDIISNTDNDYCMCGSAMKDHVHGGCGYPTGMFDYYYNQWLESDNKTPATDAFLAEVRAQCLNAFIQHHSAELDAHIKNGGEQFDEKSVRIRDIIVSARLFREQIRKGAAL
ncbi:hNH endonuclease [Enterobacter cloacae complex sp. 288G10]|uniref:hNH endonuclease n=1 Tax=Enterobacter cloacae complex TaxID=354276 RepID=UPI003CE7C922